MAKEKKEKSKFRIYAEYYPFCVLYGILHLLPLKVGYAICTFLFRLLFIADRRHRVRTIQHLVHAGFSPTRRRRADSPKSPISNSPSCWLRSSR